MCPFVLFHTTFCSNHIPIWTHLWRRSNGFNSLMVLLLFFFQWLQYYTGTGYTFRETAASLVEEQCMIGPVILSGHRATTVGRRHDEVKFYCLGITVMILYFVPSCAFAITSQPPLPLMPFPFLPLPSDPHSHPKWPVVKVSWSPVNEEVDLLARQQWKRWGGEEWNPQKPASKHSY